MATLAIFGTLVGSVLGIRFRFLILLPIIIFGSVVLITISIMQGDGLWHMISSIAVFASFLQLGYAFTAFRRYAGTVTRRRTLVVAREPEAPLKATG